MISIIEATLEVPDEGLQPYELIRLARKKKLIKPSKNIFKPNINENEYLIPLKDKSKKKIINPLTGRLKNKKGIRYIKTTVSPEERTLKNIPKDSTNKSKVKFQDWLLLSNKPQSNVGQAPNNIWYGWSHRAVGSFHIDKEIKSTTIGNKYRKDSTKDFDNETFKPYKIKTDQEAKEHAIRFANEVS